MSTRAAQNHERHSVEHARNVTESEMWWNPPAPDPAAWNAPMIEDPPLTIEEMKIRENQLHVDHVQDMVPFWIRGVEAAEKGEVLRLEQFLETLQAASDAWLNAGSDNPWVETNPNQGWGDDAWGAQGHTNRGWDAENEKADGWCFTLGADAWGVDVRSLSSADGSINRVDTPGIRRWQRRRENKKTPKNAYDFVEEVARQEAVDEERKRRMHTFFNVCGKIPLVFSTDMPTDAYA